MPRRSLRKRKRGADPAEARTMLGLDADVLAGTDKMANRTATYELETLVPGTSMYAYMAHAVSATRTHAATVGVCDEYNSVLIMNKLYGQNIDVPILENRSRQSRRRRLALKAAVDSGRIEQMHLFSAFYSREHLHHLDPTKWIYEPQYGGVTDCGLPDGCSDLDAEHVYAPRPAIMCKKTQDLMYDAGRDFGWRSLLYINKGDGDPLPTGIVALEGWLFQIVEKTIIDENTGEAVASLDATDVEDIEETARRIALIHGCALSTETDLDGGQAAAAAESAMLDDDIDDID